MTEPTRWRDNWYGDDHGEMTPHPEGEWVKYDEAAGWHDEAVGLTAWRVFREARAEAIAECIAAVEALYGPVPGEYVHGDKVLAALRGLGGSDE